MCDAAALAQFSNTASIGGAATSVIGAVGSAVGAHSQASIADTNARLSTLAAEAALVQGQHEEESSRLQYADLRSKQRVALSGNGVDLTSDSARRTLTTTDFLGEIDAQTIKANAVRTAFGYRTQAVGYGNRAAGLRTIDPFAAGASTLLGSGAQVARGWYTLNKDIGPKSAVTPIGPGGYEYGQGNPNPNGDY